MHWGLIGASTIASQYMIGAIRAQAGHEILSVLSSDAERGAVYAGNHEIGASTVLIEDILDDDRIGAVYISTTNEKHLPHAMAAIEAGKHVLCEKPLAMKANEAAEIAKAAHQAGVVLGTNHHLRNAGSHLAIKQLIDEGEIGEVLSIRIFHAVMLPENLRGWRVNNPAAGGGVIPDIVVHDADTVRFHLEEDPETVMAIESASAMSEGVEDSSMTLWQMPSGVQVMTHESFTHPFAPTGFEVHGTRGSAFGRNVMTQEPVGGITLHNADGARNISFSQHNLYERSVRLFAEAMAGTGSPAASGVDGVKSLAVAEAVKLAATTGQRTNVFYPGV